MDPVVGLVRRWAVGWLNAADPAVVDEILPADYRILIGGHVLEGRDAYVAGTRAQMERFPGLGLTVHELICAGDRVAVRFTLHGADARRDGRAASWCGVALFASDRARLTQCWAEEDYLSRRRQLSDGRCDPIELPAPAPWSTAPGQRDPRTEDVVREWLRRGDLTAATPDDGWLGHPAPPLLAEASVEIHELFSAGNAVAFHARQSGRYVGGLNDAERGVETGAAGVPASHHLAGIVTVRDGAVAGGRIVRDRLGLARALSG